ncbi:DUF6950 family protein [Allorhizobium undicola]|uniref:DUF6950 family protein n=1 Tax=Allorhizobium undicola TaxID=78527 RepID=UPI000487A951|nr:hypothetical protein [Allorhizobium undicola]
MIADIDGALRAYIEAAQDLPYEWGKSDCTSWAAAWVERVHGRKVKRPRWKSQDEAHALIARRGSLLALWSDVLEEFGLQPGYGDPQPGDVGLIETRLAGVVGGIFIQHGLFCWRGEPYGTRPMMIRSYKAFWSIR